MKKNMQRKKMEIDILLGRIDSFYGLSKLKNEFDLTSLEDILRKVLSTKNKAKSFLYSGLLPRSYAEVFTGELLVYKSNQLERELLWNSMLIRTFASEINEFISLRNRFEISFLNGNYETALNNLSDIEKNVCYSLWTLENRFLTEEYKNGLEGNKNFLNQINNIQNNSTLLIFADVFSYKVEKNITEPQFKNRMTKVVSRVTDDNSRPFLQAKIFGFQNDFSLKELSDILYFEGMSSIIDRYLAFLKVIQILSSIEKLDSKLYGIIEKCLNLIGPTVCDRNLDNIRVFLDIEVFEAPTEVDFILNDIGHQYTQGNYTIVLEHCRGLLEDYSNHFEIYEYLVKAALYTGVESILISKDTVKDEIITNMHSSYIKQKTTDEAIQTLTRYSRVFNNTTFGSNLLKFYMNRYSKEKLKSVSKVAELNTKHRNARFSLVYSDLEDRIRYLNKFSEIYGDRAQVRLFKCFYYFLNDIDQDVYIDDIPQDRIQWYDIKRNIRKHNFDYSLEQLRYLEKYYSMESNDIKYYKLEKVFLGLFNVLLKKKDYLGCLNLFINTYLDNEFMTIRLNHHKLYELIIDNLSLELKSNIELPILTHICFKHQITKLYTSYANFLDSISVTKPTELIGRIGEFDTPKLIYFLRNVCVPDVIDSTYGTFDSLEKVENERIAICQFLREVDSQNDSDYVNEISQITQKNSLSKRIQILDESKIDVDLRNVRSSKKEIFSENYRRYIDIGNFEESYNILDMANSKIFLIKVPDKTATAEKKNQKYVLFKEMFLDFRDECAFGQYGLDSSLSTRIRHGRLQNQIRNVFEQYYLVNSKDSYNSTNYIPNVDLENALSASGFNNRFIKSVNGMFANFSKQIDDTIDEINSTWVRIRTENLNPKGMFDFLFTEKELLFYFSGSNDINNDELLLDYFEMILTARIEGSLKQIRSRVKTELKERFIKYIIELEDSITQQFEDYKSNPIFLGIKQNLINCRTTIQREIDIVAEWFKLPQKQEYIDFNIEQLLETCTAINKRLHASYSDIKVEIENLSDSYFKGFTFSYFIDIFVILFTNCIVHSGFIKDLSQLKIKLQVSENHNYIIFKMLNNLSLDSDKDSLFDGIVQAKKRIEDSKDLKRHYNYEGGSGYVKVAKMLQYNILTDWKLYFGFEDDARSNYVVDILLDKHNICVGGATSENINN